MQIILKNKKLIISIVFFILSVFVFYFLYKTINDSRETFKVAEAKWQTEENYRNNVRSLSNSVKAVESKIKLLNAHFIKSSDVVPFLDTIERLAKEVNAKAEVVSVNISDTDSNLSVDLKVEGSFGSIYKFIALLENSPYHIEFSSADIQNNSISTDKNPMWLASFHIRLLSFIK